MNKTLLSLAFLTITSLTASAQTKPVPKKVISTTLPASKAAPAFLPKETGDTYNSGLQFPNVPPPDTNDIFLKKDEHTVLETLLGSLYELTLSNPTSWDVTQEPYNSKLGNFVKTTYVPTKRTAGLNSIRITTIHDSTRNELLRTVLTIKGYGKNNQIKIVTGGPTYKEYDFFNNKDGLIYFYKGDSEKLQTYDINNPKDLETLLHQFTTTLGVSTEAKKHLLKYLTTALK